MIGDQVIPNENHTAAARDIFARLKDETTGRRITVTVAGESGAGKSEIAVELARFFAEGGRTLFIFQQDDYFLYPPHTNADMRKQDITHVGVEEVQIGLLDAHLLSFKKSPRRAIVKPLVIFKEDRISEETIEPGEFEGAVAEGTYTTLLESADYRIFIDRSYEDTRGHREKRGRDAIDDFSDKILAIEHDIISKHKTLANIIVHADYSVSFVGD